MSSEMKRRFALEPESETFLRIDLMRFVAAAAIVLMHAVFYWTPQWPPLLRTLNNLRIAVDLFFAISGIVIATFYETKVRGWDGYRRFMQRRLARLVPLHWLTLGIFVAIMIASAISHIPLNDARRYDTACLLPNLALVHAFGGCSYRSFNFVSWSISAELFLYALFPLLLAVTRSWRRYLWAAALLLAVGIDALDPLWSVRTFDGGAFRAIPSFLFGMGLYFVRDRLAAFNLGDGAVAIGYLVFFGLALGFAPPLAILFGAYGLVVAGYAADLARPGVAPLRRLSGLGQLTYSIYMWHPVVATIVVAIIGGKILGLAGPASNLWLLFAMIVVLPAVSLLSLKLFESPLRRMLSPRGRPAEPLAATLAP